MQTSDLNASAAALASDTIDLLFDIARRSLEEAVSGNPLWVPNLNSIPPPLSEPGASFVTLYTHGELHGCIGSVVPKQAIAHDVAQNAMSSALNDPRFPPLREEDLKDTSIELSLLSPLKQVHYTDIDHLIEQLHPGVDGVLVERGHNRGLLLPQVWRKIPDPSDFLYQVALKAHASMEIYTSPNTKVFVFQVHHYTQPPPEGGVGKD